jgi:hypothetical protein
MQKATHNKETGLQKYGPAKNKKGIDSNRARLSVVKRAEIQLELNVGEIKEPLN